MSLGEIVTEAVRMRLEMREGMTGVELETAFERTVRAVWPFTREWHYLCETCRDTGLELLFCDGVKAFCGRRKQHHPHEYGVACTCPKGPVFRKPERTAETAVTAAAKVSKPTRFGH